MEEINMKRIVILTALLVAVIGSAMGQSKEAKEAIAYAEQFDFTTPPILPLKYCYIVLEKGICAKLTGNIYMTDDSIVYPRPIPPSKLKWECKGFLVPRGVVSLDVRYYKNKQEYIGSVGNSFSTMLKADSVYKISTINDGKNSYRAIFTPATDPEELAQAQAVIKKYEEEQNKFLSYQAQNPKRLEGKWKGEKKRMMNTFFMEYDFSSDKLRYEGKSKSLKNRPFVAEGRLFYSENIIILFPEKAYNKDKEVKGFNMESPYIWYYTIQDDILQLEGGRLFGSGFIWENTGTFHRVTSDTENQ